MSLAAAVKRRAEELGFVACGITDPSPIDDGGWLDRWLARRYGDARRIDVTAQSFSVLPQLVIGTSRIATVPLRLARLCAQSLPIRLIPAPVELPTLTEVMQWHVHRDQDLASRWLRSELAMQTALLPPAR